ncbi:MAG: NCS2 family permease [Coriobacteriia bacterium]|nr:NCS2 family permease [Coriobacteriia bacterium]
MDKFFKISERGSSITTEVVAGLTTFLAMAYIIFVNPGILAGATGGVMSFNGVLTATCIGAAVMCIFMGIFANRPIALASGMGINAVVAFTLIIGMKVPWQVAMSVIFAEGVLILLLVLFGLREAIMNAIPVNLRRAIGVGIGLFITFIGLKSAGFVTADAATLVKLGDFTSPVLWVGATGLVVTIVLRAFKVKGDILIGIIVATVFALVLGVIFSHSTVLPHLSSLKTVFAKPDFSTFAAPFQKVNGKFAILQIFTPALIIFVFALMMSDFFDTMGTLVGVGSEAGFTDKDGNVDDAKKMLIVDSVAAATGGFLGASSITSYIESASGVGDGGRTGLTVIVTGLLFALCVFFSPIIALVPESATAGALIVVGFLMMMSIKDIEWEKFEEAFPAFLILITIPLTYSITNGIGIGFIVYVIMKLLRGKVKEVKPLMWIAAAAFLVVFLQGPIIKLFS